MEEWNFLIAGEEGSGRGCEGVKGFGRGGRGEGKGEGGERKQRYFLERKKKKVLVKQGLPFTWLSAP